VSSLSVDQPKVEPNRLLKHWEKYIIPKIYDYVKASYRPYEMEDFFEQLRTPLRKGDQAGALGVAYIMCDNRLPPGTVVPDANHDWSTLDIDEVRFGQYVLAKLEQEYSPGKFVSKTHLVPGQVLAAARRLGAQSILLEVVAIDV
jgi:other hect domain ubiquitin protein ligase E3